MWIFGFEQNKHKTSLLELEMGLANARTNQSPGFEYNLMPVQWKEKVHIQIYIGVYLRIEKLL